MKSRRCIIAGIVAVVFCLGVVLIEVLGNVLTNTGGSAQQMTTSTPPATLVSSQDYFMQGDYDFDRHEYTSAILDYSSAIQLNPQFAEAYNNRAYTYMVIQDYADALLDLDRAIEIRPNYPHALMNRGDIHNYYYQIDRVRAIEDYQKVIALGPDAIHGSSVCGHFFLAKHNGWNLGTIAGIIVSVPRTIAGGEPGC